MEKTMLDKTIDLLEALIIRPEVLDRLAYLYKGIGARTPDRIYLDLELHLVELRKMKD